MTTPNALHSKKTHKWGTPQWIIEHARTLLDGVIHLDPASSPEFNERVQALMIYTEKDNGLEQPWIGNVFCNPPGGWIKEFWRLMIQPWTPTPVDGLTPYSANELGPSKRFWVGFSVEQLCQLTRTALHPMDFSFCVLRKRLAFNEQQEDNQIVTGESPSHGNYVCGMGVDHALFEKLFQEHGKVIRGVLA